MKKPAGIEMYEWNKRKERNREWGVAEHKITVLEASYWDQKNCEVYSGDDTIAIH